MSKLAGLKGIEREILFDGPSFGIWRFFTMHIPPFDGLTQVHAVSRSRVFLDKLHINF